MWLDIFLEHFSHCRYCRNKNVFIVLVLQQNFRQQNARVYVYFLVIDHVPEIIQKLSLSQIEQG